MRRPPILSFVVLAAASLLVAAQLVRAPARGAEACAPDAARLLAMRLEEPTLTACEARRLAVQGDAIGLALAAAPTPGHDEPLDPDQVGVELRRRLAAAQVDDDEALAYYRANQALFGERGFAESRATIRQLLAIRRVRRDLGVP